MARHYHINNGGTNLTSNTSAGATTSPVNAVPSITVPFYAAFDATNINGHYEEVEITGKTATNLNHAATTYAHTTAEEVRFPFVATEADEFSSKLNGGSVIPEFAPQGFMQNGKISVTDASGITVAIKTLAGADPSATDPVYVRIGDTVRTITSALSKSNADGTNYMNAGGAALATKEIDYFVHIGWNASAGTPFIGWARIPCTSIADIASYNTIDEKSLMCSQTNADGLVNTDYMEVVGRFAATLSAGAGYTWSVPTYTAINLIQRPIYETRWLDWVPTLSVSAGTAPTYTGTFSNKYKIRNDTILHRELWNNASGGTAGNGANTIIVTMPFANAVYDVDRATIGEGQIYESAGTINRVTCVQNSTTSFRFWTTTITDVSGNDQSSTVRFIIFSGLYQI